jgi:hypothetical protein
MAVPSTLRYYHDKIYRDSVRRAANCVTVEYVGRAFFDEATYDCSAS